MSAQEGAEVHPMQYISYHLLMERRRCYNMKCEGNRKTSPSIFTAVKVSNLASSVMIAGI
jgi:hypothetical protein